MTVSGQTVRLSREQVVKSLEGIAPETIQIHAVDIEGTRYPVKQAFAAVTGLDPLDFTTTQARRALKELRFEVIRTR